MPQSPVPVRGAFTREHPPAPGHRFGDETTKYWIDGDGKVRFLHPAEPVRGADPRSFRFYVNGFAKDDRNCYRAGRRLRGPNPATFRALNYTYVTDDVAVWTMGGPIKDVHAATFQVCDDGVDTLQPDVHIPHGYGKDRTGVYHYDFAGTPNRVRKADPESFISFGDGHYGRDHTFIFCDGKTLPKADVTRWHRFGLYSSDGVRVYYLNRLIRGADAATFEPTTVDGITLHMGRDRHGFYESGNPITEAELDELRAI
jgi:hypothetical protein